MNYFCFKHSPLMSAYTVQGQPGFSVHLRLFMWTTEHVLVIKNCSKTMVHYVVCMCQTCPFTLAVNGVSFERNAEHRKLTIFRPLLLGGQLKPYYQGRLLFFLQCFSAQPFFLCPFLEDVTNLPTAWSAMDCPNTLKKNNINIGNVEGRFNT